MTDLDSAADELYALAPDELDRFGPRRAELVAAARSAGDRELARQIGALKKPVQAAALANSLVRQHPEAMQALTELAGRLRDAHRHLRGAELRELSEQRQHWLAGLAELGRALAGRPVGDQVLSQLRATFEAAIADEAAEEAVKSGRLTAALSYSGFGEVDLSDAVAAVRRLRAVPDLVEPAGRSGQRSDGANRARDGAGSHPGTDGGADRAARQRAELALQRADAAAETAERAVADAADELAEADTAERAAAARVEQLEQELDSARRAVTAAAKAAVAAGREHARRVRAFERADHARQQAEAELEQLLEDG